jgi:hypothetical protein
MEFARSTSLIGLQELRCVPASLKITISIWTNRRRNPVMRINLMKFTIGAILLATLSLLLQGCGGSSSESPPKYTDKKQLSGTVSDIVTNLPISGVSVVAYPIVDGVPKMSVPLSKTNISDNSGYYLLHIPVSYTGSILVEATAPPAKLVNSPAKLTALTYTSSRIRAVIPENIVRQTRLPPVMLNFASEAAVLFIEMNLLNPVALPNGFSSPGFTSDNIRMTLIELETFFGVNFSETALPEGTADTTATKAQLDLLVSIKAIQAVLANHPTITLQDIVTKIATTGLGTLASEITDGIRTITAQLILTGTLPSGYIPSAAIVAAISSLQNGPIQPVSLNDTTSPSAPSGLSTAVSSSSSINLAWSASTDDEGVAGYLIYRAMASGVYTHIDTVWNAVIYSDIMAAPGTAYTYKVVAFDAARNFSAASNTASATIPIPVNPGDTQLYTLSGRVTYNGAGVSGVVLTIIGTGYGSTISDANGNYSFTQVINGSYSISAALDGYLFFPANLSFSVNGANISNLDFVSDKPGLVTGDTTYPLGTIIGGITYPSGTVIGGVTYPTATVIGGVAYPTGTVIGGVTYPNGVVIGGVSYPSGTVVGGVAFPLGTVITNITVPAGTILGGVTYPSATILGSVTSPSATVDPSLVYPL